MDITLKSDKRRKYSLAPLVCVSQTCLLFQADAVAGASLQGRYFRRGTRLYPFFI